jgi:hypothetical protein
VAREQIVADYAATTDNMPGILDRIRSSSFFQGNGLAAAPAWIFQSTPETMRAFLSWLDEEVGGTERWATSNGLSPASVERLRANLLETTGGRQPGGSGTTVPGSSGPR